MASAVSCAGLVITCELGIGAAMKDRLAAGRLRYRLRAMVRGRQDFGARLGLGGVGISLRQPRTRLGVNSESRVGRRLRGWLLLGGGFFFVGYGACRGGMRLLNRHNAIRGYRDRGRRRAGWPCLSHGG